MRHLLGLLCVTACASPAIAPLKDAPTDTASPGVAPTERPELSEPVRFFRRVALDVTGHLPSPEALARVAAEPSTLDSEIGLLLDDPGVTDRMVHLLDERWHLRFEAIPVDPLDYGLAATDRYHLARSIAEEPLRQAAHVITSDASWDRIVLADTTRANAQLLDIWPLEALGEPDDSGWMPARWTDYRPAVGILASNGLWWRYNTTAFNHNRTRAAAVSRLLLCDDYLERPVEFESPSLTDADGTATALRDNPSCTVCHDTLDPLASAFFGFWAYDLYDPLELSRYHPEREPLGAELTGRAPAYFGSPITGLAELGRHITQDARFPRCAVETFAQGLWRRPLAVDDNPLLTHLTERFEAGDRRVKPLLAELTATGEYVGDLAQDPAPDATPHLVGPQQLAAVLDETVGFSWTYRGEDQLDSDWTGLRVPLGGIDGEEVTGPKRQVDVGLILAWRATAQAAGRHALGPLESGTLPLLPGATLATRPADTAFQDAVSHAIFWLTGTEATPDLIAAYATLFDSAPSADEGWAAVVTALLLDPAFLVY